MISDDDYTSAGGHSSDATILEPPKLGQGEGSSVVADNIDVSDNAFPFDSDGLDSMMDTLPPPSTSQPPVRNPSNQRLERQKRIIGAWEELLPTLVDPFLHYIDATKDGLLDAPMHLPPASCGCDSSSKRMVTVTCLLWNRMCSDHFTSSSYTDAR